MKSAEIIFWFGFLLLAYTYFGYPIVLFICTKVKKPSVQKRLESQARLPRVSMLIAAYNEERVIARKITNCLNLDYPAELFDIWIASDGSSDGTNATVKTIMQNSERVHLLEFPRMGKSGVLNKALPHVESEIVVFSDANTEYKSDALYNLVSHFTDPEIGCVCGRLIYRNPGKILSGEGESFYWRYETNLKKMESNLGYVAGANGAIYAIRRELFQSLPPNTINDDFTISMSIVQKGLKSIYVENAIAYEDVAPTMESEFRRHVRDGAGHYIAIIHLLRLLNPLLGIKSFIYISHRFLRWAAPILLILEFLVNIALLKNQFYGLLFSLQIIFYVLAALGYLLSRLIKQLPVILYAPFYFCNLHMALLFGLARVAAGKQNVTWESTERTVITNR